MSNLGAYQEVTTAAKQAGGMENYIALIKDGAVAAAEPGIFNKGAAIGATGALAVTGVVYAAKRYWARRALRIELGKAAEAELLEGR